jgi:hypothetical protein
MTQTNPDNEKYFEELKELISKFTHQFTTDVIKEIYSFAIQYCIKKLNSGNQKYYKEIFELYKSSLHLKLLLTNNELPPFDFKNIVTTALRINEFDWTENFIKEYNSHLPIEHQENAYTFNMARVYFFQKKYDNVLKLLQQVEYDDVFYLLDSKLLLIKTFYELKEYDSLIALIESFKMLLRRKKTISNDYKIRYSKLIAFVKKIINYNNDPIKIKKMQTELENSKDTPDIIWLTEKIEELLKKKR